MAGTDLTMTTSDGVRIVYDDEGAGSTFLLVHGYDGHRGHWEFQRDVLLDAGHRVVAMDQRGHWASETPSHGLRMARLGQDLRELVDLLDLEDITLVGHSMGVSVSLAMFSLSGVAPVTRFVAIEQSPKLTNDEHWSCGARGLDWHNVYEIAYRRAVLGQPELEPPMPEGAAMAVTEETFDHASVSPLLLDHLVADWRDVLPQVAVPTWVVVGRLSPFYDVAGMEWFAANVPDGRLTVFERSGHSPHVTEANEFNRQLFDFFDASR